MNLMNTIKMVPDLESLDSPRHVDGLDGDEMIQRTILELEMCRVLAALPVPCRDLIELLSLVQPFEFFEQDFLQVVAVADSKIYLFTLASYSALCACSLDQICFLCHVFLWMNSKLCVVVVSFYARFYSDSLLLSTSPRMILKTSRITISSLHQCLCSMIFCQNHVFDRLFVFGPL